MSALLKATIEKKNSVVQKIWNSLILSTRLKTKIKTSGNVVGGSAANLHAAKHRFESFAGPLGRMLLHLEEFLELVQEICDERQESDEGRTCWAWLSDLDEEQIIQLGMLADCADEILVATRGVDKEDVDTSTMHSEAMNLLARLDALFNKQQCLKMGYTQHVLRILKRKRIFYGPKGVIRSIGKECVDDELQCCFQRMRAYCALVNDVVETEFPDYELFCAFSVFDLNSKSQDLNINDAAVCANMKRLAQAFKVSETAFREQWLRLRHVAQQSFAMHSCNKSAWQVAIQKAQRHHSTKHNWTIDALVEVALRFVGWTAATSGVEQNFSKAMRSIGPQRMSMTEENEETAVRFAVYKPERSEMDDVIARARKIWTESYGAPRNPNKEPRLDKGAHHRQRNATDKEIGETDWLKRRRIAAREAGASLGDPSALSVRAAEACPGWTAGHDAEHAFQVKKRDKKRLHAFADGILLPDEIADGMQEALDIQNRKDATNDQATKRKHVGDKRRRKTAQLKLQAGTRVCMMCADNEKVRHTLLGRRLTIDDELSVRTEVMVVHDPAKLNKQQLWIAVLTGALVCSIEAVLNERTGPFLKYSAAIQTQKRLVLTPDFKAKHSLISNLIQEASQLPSSEWKLCNGNHRKFVTLGGNLGKSATEFLTSITKVDRCMSRLK